MVTRLRDGTRKPKILIAFHYPVNALICSPEPSCYTQASKVPEWCAAMSSEYNALIKNGTWVLVLPSPQANIIGCKWIFKLERKADGAIER